MTLSSLPATGAQNFNSLVRTVLNEWKTAIEGKAASAHAHDGGDPLVIAIVSDVGSLGTGAQNGQFAVDAQTGNFYSWDDDNGQWRIAPGNIYSTDPSGGSVTLEEGTIIYDSSTGALQYWTVNETWTPLGRMVQQVRTSTSSLITGTTQIPLDDTVPQNTEGVEVMTLAITPKDASNILVVEASVIIGSSVGTIRATLALFQDSTAAALAAVTTKDFDSASAGTCPLRYSMTPGATDETTFKLRAGLSGAGTININGINGSRLYGGVAMSTLTVTELLP